MAALAAKAIKDQRRKALKLAEQVVDQKQILNNQRKQSLTSISTVGTGEVCWVIQSVSWPFFKKKGRRFSRMKIITIFPISTVCDISNEDETSSCHCLRWFFFIKKAYHANLLLHNFGGKIVGWIKKSLKQTLLVYTNLAIPRFFILDLLLQIMTIWRNIMRLSFIKIACVLYICSSS